MFPLTSVQKLKWDVNKEQTCTSFFWINCPYPFVSLNSRLQSFVYLHSVFTHKTFLMFLLSKCTHVLVSSCPCTCPLPSRGSFYVESPARSLATIKARCQKSSLCVLQPQFWTNLESIYIKQTLKSSLQ